MRSYFTRHAWWGKILGAGLGFLMAGPSGALLGIFVGNLFDRGLAEHFTRPHLQYHQEKSKGLKQAFLMALFSIMGHIAKADKRVSEKEIDFARTVMLELRLSVKECTAAQNFFMQGKTPGFKISEPLALLQGLAQDNPKLMHTFMQLQYRMAQVDGLTESKITTLNILLHKLGFASMHQQPHVDDRFHSNFNSGFHAGFNQHKHQHKYWQHGASSSSSSSNQAYGFYTPRSINDAYTELNVKANATKQDVKQAYRRLVSLYHPDKRIAKGESEHEIKAANEKTQAIRKAYEEICQHKGW